MTARPRARLGSLFVLVVAAAVRLAAHPQMAAAEDTFAPIIDGEAYLLQALRWADGRDIVDGVYFQAPLYPIVLGTAFRLAGVPGVSGVHAVSELPADVLGPALAVGRGLNLVLGLLAVWLILHTGRRLFGEGAGLAAGLLAAVYMPFVFYEGLLLKVPLSLLFLPWAVLAAARSLRSGRPGALAWCGVALGLGGLVRGNIHLLTLLGLVSLAWIARDAARRRFALRGAVALLSGVALVMAPIVVRNSIVSGRLVLSTAAGGTAFYLCNHPDNDTGIIQHRALNRQVPRYELEDWTAEAEQRVGRPMDPGDVSRFWLREAMSGIASRPGTWALAETRKLALLASRYEAPDNTMPSFAEAECPALAWSPVRYGSVLPLALAGAVLAWRRRRLEAPAAGRVVLALALIGYGLSLLPFIVTSRFRIPLAPLVLVYAGYLISRLRLLAADRGWQDRLVCGAAVAGGWLLSLVSEGPLGPLSEKERASHLAVAFKNRAQVAAVRLHQDEAAFEDLRRAIDVAAGAGIASPALHAELARLHRLLAHDWRGIVTMGDEVRRALGAAQAELDRALALDPDDGASWREQGLLHYERDRLDDVVVAMRRALPELPRDREVHQYLALALLYLGRRDEAEAPARFLTEHRPDADDGWALLTLSLLDRRPDEARDALEQYDRAATMRESRGWSRLIPDQPDFQRLRSTSSP